MAFMRYATADIIQPHVSSQTWGRIRTASNSKMTSNLVGQAGEIFGDSFDPKNYVLTHATIVCSVDVDEVPNVKLGADDSDDGFQINRKYADFRIAPKCDKYINNNLDAWSRDVLMKSYRTFVGSHNFVEHVQIEDQSKGRIIDAVARDIGDSVYIDILVATDRKHTELVKSIQNGKVASMSMGCTVDFTLCTKCGHVAKDETEMCRHVRYEKGNTFFDEGGNQHRIAELCGHPSIDPNGGVTFIEASWVATPAFGGAVMRNILENPVVDAEIVRLGEEALNSPPPQWDQNSYQKAARTALDWPPEDEGGAAEGGEEDGEPKEEAPAQDPLDALQAEIQSMVLESVKKKLQEKINKANIEKELTPEDSTMHPNDNVIKEGTVNKTAEYVSGLRALAKTSRSNVDLMNNVAKFDGSYGMSVGVPIYRAALAVGSFSNFTSSERFLTACREQLGRTPTESESRKLIRLGKTLSLREDNKGASRQA